MNIRSALKHAAMGVPATTLAFGLAANANALEIGCKTQAQLPQLREQMAQEQQIPVLQFHIDGRERGAKDPKWVQTLFTMNPATNKGHTLLRTDDGGMCVTSSLTNIKLYDNRKSELDKSAYITAQNANAEKGGVNRIIFGLSKHEGMMPMLRAEENIPGLKLQSVTYVVGNKDTGAGQVIRSSFQGSVLDDYSKGIPAEYGAKFTKSGESIIAQQQKLLP